ncbi:MAG TPA: entericidin A/B family lipoprotein [Casimicrobiaceae bacterium]|nr:entericidin A/B family lipoprotein [Casimicrobiaceae bacterium]
MLKKIVLAMAGAYLVAVLGACNTMEGAGKDVSAGGKKITEEAKEQKQKM